MSDTICAICKQPYESSGDLLSHNVETGHFFMPVASRPAAAVHDRGRDTAVGMPPIARGRQKHKLMNHVNEISIEDRV